MALTKLVKSGECKALFTLSRVCVCVFSSLSPNHDRSGPCFPHFASAVHLIQYYWALKAESSVHYV